MCKADRNSGYLANKSRKGEDEVRVCVCACVRRPAWCERAMTRRSFAWYRWSVPEDAAGAARAELLFIAVSSVDAKRGERFLWRRRHVNVVHLLL